MSCSVCNIVYTVCGPVIHSCKDEISTIITCGYLHSGKYHVSSVILGCTKKAVCDLKELLTYTIMNMYYCNFKTFGIAVKGGCIYVQNYLFLKFFYDNKHQQMLS